MTKTEVSFNTDKSWTVRITQENGTEVVQTIHPEGIQQVAMLALLNQVTKYQEREKLWTSPTLEMTQAGLAEVQRMLDEWAEEISVGEKEVFPDDITDDQASNMAVFVLQAMAGELPKVGE